LYRPKDFSRAQVYQLQFQPLQALPHLEKAHRYRPENVDYALAYAELLQEQHEFKPAETIYTEILSRLRERAKSDPAAYLPDVAMTLNNLGILYRATQRLAEADKAYQEALQIRRELARQNPAAYLPGVAGTLNNLADFYKASNRPKDTDQLYRELKDVRRRMNSLQQPEKP
jgi:tetratricopeptide (TPR) repeat protein